MVKLFLAFIFSLSAFFAYAQKWEWVHTEGQNAEIRDRVSDITAHGDRIYIVGIQGDHTNLESFFGFSDDEGKTWDKVILNSYISVDGTPISVGFFNSNEGIIGIKGSLTKEYLRTNDGGYTWQTFSPDLCNDTYVPQPFDIVIINDTTVVISHFQSGNYITSTDKGLTWSCNTDFSTSWAPKFTYFGVSRYFNFDQNAIYTSEDAGLTWSIALDKRDISTYQMQDENIGYAVSYYYSNEEKIPVMYQTIDGWKTAQNTALTDFYDKIVGEIASISKDTIYFFQAKNIYLTNNGGMSVSFLQELDFEPFRVVKINSGWYATGRGLVKYNPDGRVVTRLQPNAKLETTKVFPNPVTDGTIKLNSTEYNLFELYNLQGKSLYSGNIYDSTIDLNLEFKGYCLLKLVNEIENSQKILKVLIQ